MTNFNRRVHKTRIGELAKLSNITKQHLINAAAGGCAGVVIRWGRHAVGSVRGGSSPYWAGAVEVFAECGAVIVAVVDASVLKDGDDLVDECIDPVLIDVDGHPEPVAGTGFKPFLHVIRGDRCLADGGGVVVDDTVGEDVAESLSFPCDLQARDERGSKGLEVATASWAGVRGSSSCRFSIEPR
ncbi:hypothetical protein [Arthrobacter sp. Z1-9]